ncbi:MAG: UDP-N-acetylmuramate:L-alanyl-gamma-D-glutamyl-meso-diaminopimelate ligase [Pseudomonadota bacterium]|nr:UDP-N-acetylmuramate:L-alanyl-gamma-D-glutamyl-meso-diaminopimelate ligase [Pseudomonadota bacterium]
MRIQILGACGKFMSGLALMAKQLGFDVSGIDKNIHSELADQLRDVGIPLTEGYGAELLDEKADMVVVGNVMSRGYPIVEALLDAGLPYVSGPQWLAEQVLHSRWVIAVSGTHGKTTTTSIVSWILECAGLNPGFLIGGIPNNFGITARLTDSKFFVIEADEYDSAFFDKRPKFIHYRPRTAIINNIEFDHADIYADLPAIQTQFQYLVRTVPACGAIIANGADDNVSEVLARGCWSECIRFGVGDWQAKELAADGSSFQVIYQGDDLGRASWNLIGQHNVNNALAAIAAAVHVGVKPEQAIAALKSFTGVERRMQLRGEVSGVKIYDDFAHHPTAIKTTLAGMRANLGDKRIFTIVDFGSYTMRTGHHHQALVDVFGDADGAFFLAPENIEWDVAGLAKKVACTTEISGDLTTLSNQVAARVTAGDVVLILSNQDSMAIVKALGVQ